MISKVCSGHSFYGSIRYVCQAAKKAEILASEGVREYDEQLMIEDFERKQEFRPEKTKACFHGILSFYPGENPSDQLIREIALKYLTGLDISNTQFAVVKHTDKAHLHVHLIANLVNNDGGSISDKWIGLRGKKLAQQLTIAYKLKQGLTKHLSRTDLTNLRAPGTASVQNICGSEQVFAQMRFFGGAGKPAPKVRNSDGVQIQRPDPGTAGSKFSVG